MAEATWAAVAELERAGMRVSLVHISGLEQADAALLSALMPEATLIHQAWLRDLL